MDSHKTSKFEWPEAKLAELRKLWTQGIGARQIAAILGEGYTRSGVRGQAKKLGLQSIKAPDAGDADVSSEISSLTVSNT